jgi:hypothetical protein
MNDDVTLARRGFLLPQEAPKAFTDAVLELAIDRRT